VQGPIPTIAGNTQKTQESGLQSLNDLRSITHYEKISDARYCCEGRFFFGGMGINTAAEIRQRIPYQERKATDT